MFIQVFKVFVQDAVSSEAERIAHLKEALTPEIRKTSEVRYLIPAFTIMRSMNYTSEMETRKLLLRLVPRHS